MSSIETNTGALFEVEAWAHVPKGWTAKDFHDHLVDLGNDVQQFNPSIGDHGAYKIAVFVPQED